MIEQRRSPPRASHEVGDYVTWLLVALLGVLGPVMAHAAHDNEIYLFGLSLLGFSAIFLFFEVKRHYDLVDRLRAAQEAEARHE